MPASLCDSHKCVLVTGGFTPNIDPLQKYVITSYENFLKKSKHLTGHQDHLDTCTTALMGQCSPELF